MAQYQEDSGLTEISFFLSFFSFLPPFFLSVCLSVFLRQYLAHKEVPRLGVELEPELPAYIIATATDSSLVCELHTPQLTATLDPQPNE